MSRKVFVNIFVFVHDIAPCINLHDYRVDTISLAAVLRKVFVLDIARFTRCFCYFFVFRSQHRSMHQPPLPGVDTISLAAVSRKVFVQDIVRFTRNISFEILVYFAKIVNYIFVKITHEIFYIHEYDNFTFLYTFYQLSLLEVWILKWQWQCHAMFSGTFRFRALFTIKKKHI